MLETERDADQGDAEEYSESCMQERDFYAAEDNPDDVHQNGKDTCVVGSGSYLMTERPKSKACNLEKLHTEWDTDNGNAEKQTHQSIVKTDQKAS